jgi:uncharacterized protein (UPF0276 family)
VVLCHAWPGGEPGFAIESKSAKDHLSLAIAPCEEDFDENMLGRVCQTVARTQERCRSDVVFNNMADAQNHARKCLEDQLIVTAALVDDKGGHAIHYNQIQEWLVRGI